MSKEFESSFLPKQTYGCPMGTWKGIPHLQSTGKCKANHEWTIQLIPTEGATIKRRNQMRRNNCGQGCWKRGNLHALCLYLFIYGGTGSLLLDTGSLVATSGGNSLDTSIQARHTGSVTVAHRLHCPTESEISPDQGLNSCPLHWQTDS